MLKMTYDFDLQVQFIKISPTWEAECNDLAKAISKLLKDKNDIQGIWTKRTKKHCDTKIRRVKMSSTYIYDTQRNRLKIDLNKLYDLLPEKYKLIANCKTS